MVENNDKDSYIRALEDELRAAIEREDNVLEKDLGFGEFVAEKIRKTKLFTKVLSEPDSRAGKIARMPRSIYRIIKNPEVRKNLMQKKTVNDAESVIIQENHFLDPWMIDIEKRREVAYRALKKGKKLAIYYVEKPDNSTFRYRCYNTFQATLESERWQSVYFFKYELDIMEELVPRADLMILGRQSGQEKAIDSLIRMAHENGMKVGLDIDDLVFDMKYLDVVLDTINQNDNRSYWLAYFASVQAMARRADCFITTNQFLLDKIQKSFDKPRTIIRNSLNKEQVSASQVYVKRKKGCQDEQFIMGYFSGSPTHKKDLDEALPEVLKFLDKHDGAILSIVGFMRFSKETKKYIDDGRIVFLPMVDFRKLQRMMSEVDVNIAPLVINDFTNCKSELKFFEAAAVETTTIASPTYAFKKAIKDGRNGFLAKPGEWYDKLEYLYNHPKENRAIAKRAREYALNHYYGREFLEEVEAAYDYFAK